MLRAHEDEEDRKVCALPDAVSVEVGTDAHAVAMRAGIEWRGVKANCACVVHSVGSHPSSSAVFGGSLVPALPD